MNTPHRYTAFNLTIASSIPLPAFISSTSAQADVTIDEGVVPSTLAAPTARGVLYDISANEFLLRVDGIARYHVHNGRHIAIQRAMPLVDKDSVRLFLMGSAFGALLHQRGLLPIHGSSIATPHGAVIFAGASGAGKSTTAAGFIERGYPLLSDDISVITFDETGNAFVVPGYPQLKLWAEALGEMAMDTENLQRVRPQLEKYSLPVTAFETQAQPLYRVYALLPTNTKTIKVTTITGLTKVLSLRNRIYRARFAEEMERPVMMGITRAIGDVLYRRVERPIQPFMLSDLLDAVEADFV